MPKRPAAAEVESQPAQTGTEAPKLWIKLLVSGLVAAHLTAVFVAPLAFAASYSSPAVNTLYGLVRPYAAALYLDHGYFFFAPQVGPSHLIDYTVEFDDGRPPVTGRFPNLATERPRLLYHRHFMLTESLNTRFQYPLTPPPEPTPPPLTATAEEKVLWQATREEDARQRESWKQARKLYDAMHRSFSDHLLSEYGGSRVTLKRIEHVLPSPAEVNLAGRRLDDPRSYVEQPEPPQGADR